MSDESVGAEVERIIAEGGEPGTLEDELQAMSWIVDGFAVLDSGARQRVIDWARAKWSAGSDHDIRMSLIVCLTELLDAIAAHCAATAEPSVIDATLYETLRNTKYDKSGLPRQRTGARS